VAVPVAVGVNVTLGLGPGVAGEVGAMWLDRGDRPPDGGVAGVRWPFRWAFVAMALRESPWARCREYASTAGACNVGGAWPGLEGVAVVAGPAAGDVGWRKIGTIWISPAVS
jgi:hypothetical protein